MLLVSTYATNVAPVNIVRQTSSMSTPSDALSETRTDRYHHGDLRAALLDAAVHVLAEQGVSGLSLRECARRAGVSHAAPYRHFPSKEALLAAIASQGFAWLYEVGVAAMAPIADPVARLDAYGLSYVQFALAHPQHFRLMFTSECTLVAPTAQEQSADRAYVLLRDAAAAVSAPGVDPDVAAVAYWSRPHGLAMLLLDARIPAVRMASPEALEELIRATVHGDRWTP